ncbi:hypothetical protein PCANC_24721 [Puccinia coronata f. sp. avenae]|uniref:Nucleoporin Nup133/Nup155-like C-terminal domain-containing protein n=1 Tax=Puccinia coronata f. sp. avenae TaxID=200324 RepID=A0A2N5SGP0_9BASI|nr:hypothetical protein PCANC_24721 [Puccinia coronata f. sp. avenae]PLW12428.1 hypothetical protein PCASD_21413 [Puccinia coronata f. sp. avenae]PLW51521.1 hypothetical protein PCASD_00294 [Puccinia coronata f. sp. avenae]
MFSQSAPKPLPNTRKRNGLRSQSRLSSAGPQESNHQNQNDLYGANNSQAQPEGSKKNALGVPRNPPGSLRNRSVTPIGRIDASKAITITEEQTHSLEEGLKQANQAGNAVSLLLQDDFHAVTAYSPLPSDVVKMVSKVDINVDALKGHIDHVTGFACVWSRRVCCVWNFTRRTATLPTCYSFPCPISNTNSVLVNTLAPLPLASLISHSSNLSNATRREPGLLLISTTGELRAWDSLSLALSGVDKFATIQIQLQDAELVRCLQPLMSCPGSFIIATSHTRLFRISISPGMSGRPTVVSSLMSRSTTWGTKLGSLIRWGQAYDPKAGIVALAASPPLEGDTSMVGGEVWALEVTGNLQRWQLGFTSGSEKFLWEKEINSIVLESLGCSSDVDVLTMAERIEFTLLDAKVTYTRDLAVLVSYINDSEVEQAQTSIQPRSYAIVILEVLSSSSLPVVSHIVKAKHREYPDPRPETSPSLSLPNGGPAAFIVFPERIVCLSLSEGADYEEIVSLKSQANNRNIGHGATPLIIRAVKDKDEKSPTIKLITTSSGILEIALDSEELEKLGTTIVEEQIIRDTYRLKTQLEQAVFFGDNDANPVEFHLQADLSGNLGEAAEKLSQGILSSSAAHLPPIVDLRAQLADRIGRLQLLIRFINSTGMLNKVPKHGQRRLSSHLELLAATNALWLHHNNKINALSHSGRRQRTFLSEVIITYMNSLGQKSDQDIIRSFFRNHASDIVSILVIVQSKLKSGKSTKLHTRSSQLMEANEILLTVYNAAIDIRKTHIKMYDLENDTTTEPWTSTLNLLDILQSHYEATLDILQQRTREFGSAMDDERAPFGADSANLLMGADEDANGVSSDKSQWLHHTLKDQLIELVEKSLAMMRERMTFLESTLGMTHPDTKSIQERYLRLRPQLIFGLVKVKRQARAINLAEEQKDFRTLVELCHALTPSETEQRERNYISKYREEFAFQLYQWYVEQGRYHELLSQDPIYAPFITSFLDKMDYGKVSWIHDLAIDRFGHASQVLLKEAEAEKNLADQKIMLSLGKLCKVAQIDEGEHLDSEKILQEVENVDDRLDILQAQLRLCEQCKTILESQPQYSLFSLEQQIEVLTQHLAPNLDNRPAFKQLFDRYIRQILAGDALKIEDLIEFYGLKANLDEQVEDFVIALDVFSRAKDLVPGRAQLALKSVWRRIYIHEDWQALKKSSNLSDQDLIACLKSTALYHVLSSAIDPHDSGKVGLPISSPSECFFDLTISLNDDLAIRFPDHSLFELEQLSKDYQAENRKLQESIESGGVWEYYGEIVRLIRESDARSDDAAGDVSMMSQ